MLSWILPSTILYMEAGTIEVPPGATEEGLKGEKRKHDIQKSFHDTINVIKNNVKFQESLKNSESSMTPEDFFEHVELGKEENRTQIEKGDNIYTIIYLENDQHERILRVLRRNLNYSDRAGESYEIKIGNEQDQNEIKHFERGNGEFLLEDKEDLETQLDQLKELRNELMEQDPPEEEEML